MNQASRRATWVPLGLGVCFLAGAFLGFGRGPLEILGVLVAWIPLAITVGAVYRNRAAR